MAADSAVTATVDGGNKIFPSANKLFTLSKYQPVGVMIYNSAELLGIPWEIAVKTYRKNLESRSFASLEDYALDFLKFLESHEGLFPKKTIENYTIKEITGLFESIRDKIVKTQIIKKMESDSGEANYEEIIDNIIEANYRQAKEMPLFQTEDGNDWTKDQIKDIEKKYVSTITKIRDNVFSKLLYGISPQQKRKLTETGKLSLSRAVGAAGYTGVVIAGYGTDNFFPVLTSFEVYGNISGRLRYIWNNHKQAKVDDENDAVIIPFAQSEMVNTFMEGIDPSLQKTINESLLTAIQTTVEGLMENYSGKLNKEEIVDNIVKRVLKELTGTIRQEKLKHFINPILSVLGTLPKTELASMAESLVNLTSMKRHISSVSETVGGPIDVALISKGDGFVWIKRKHYFDKDLNFQFFANYFKEGGAYENGKEE